MGEICVCVHVGVYVNGVCGKCVYVCGVCVCGCGCIWAFMCVSVGVYVCVVCVSVGVCICGCVCVCLWVCVYMGCVYGGELWVCGWCQGTLDGAPGQPAEGGSLGGSCSGLTAGLQGRRKCQAELTGREEERWDSDRSVKKKHSEKSLCSVLYAAGAEPASLLAPAGNPLCWVPPASPCCFSLGPFSVGAASLCSVVPQCSEPLHYGFLL